jgi:hypothetical protein
VIRVKIEVVASGLKSFNVSTAPLGALVGGAGVERDLQMGVIASEAHDRYGNLFIRLGGENPLLGSGGTWADDACFSVTDGSKPVRIRLPEGARPTDDAFAVGRLFVSSTGAFVAVEWMHARSKNSGFLNLETWQVVDYYGKTPVYCFDQYELVFEGSRETDQYVLPIQAKPEA